MKLFFRICYLIAMSVLVLYSILKFPNNQDTIIILMLYFGFFLIDVNLNAS